MNRLDFKDSSAYLPFRTPEVQMIREIRLRSGISQKSLARRAHVDPGHLSRIESGRRTPSVPVLARLLGALRCSAEEYKEYLSGFDQGHSA